MTDDRKTNGSSDHDFDLDYLRSHFPQPSPMKCLIKSPNNSPDSFPSNLQLSPNLPLNFSPQPKIEIREELQLFEHKPKDLLIQDTLPNPKIKELYKSSHKESKGRPWSVEEDELLKTAANLYCCKNWKAIAKMVPGRSHSQCSQRWRRIQPYKIRQPWTKDEDKQLMDLVGQYGQNWSLISSSIEGRTGKQVRERWLNKLNPEIDRSRFMEKEDENIVELYKKLGPKWKDISKEMKGRTENMVKNRFYSSIKKNLLINNPEVYKELFQNDMKLEENEAKIQQKVVDIEDLSKKRDIESILEACEKEEKPVNGNMMINEGFQEEKIEKIEKIEGKNGNEPLERMSFLSRKKEVLEGLLMKVMGQIQQRHFMNTNEGE